jgi:hypothetical protein
MQSISRQKQLLLVFAIISVPLFIYYCTPVGAIRYAVDSGNRCIWHDGKVQSSTRQGNQHPDIVKIVRIREPLYRRQVARNNICAFRLDKT